MRVHLLKSGYARSQKAPLKISFAIQREEVL